MLIEFGYSESRENSISRIILGGWNGEKTRLSHYNPYDDLYYNIQYREHTKEEWENFRSNIRIRITDELIRVTTNDTGTFMNTGQPLELRSTETFEGELKRVLRYLFIRIKGSKLSYEGTLGVKLYN